MFNFTIINLSSAASDELIKRGVRNAQIEGAVLPYIGKTQGKDNERIAASHWNTIYNALGEILNRSNLGGFHIIKDTVTGYLMDDKVLRKNADPIGLGVQEYAKHSINR